LNSSKRFGGKIPAPERVTDDVRRYNGCFHRYSYANRARGRTGMRGISDEYDAVFGPFLDMLDFSLEDIKGIKIFHFAGKRCLSIGV
jgi:hypothetical protein